MSREYCPKCMKASSTCICQWLQIQENQTPVLILQHLDEVKKTLGTAKLVELGLKQAKVVSGISFSKAEIYQQLSLFNAFSPILLYAHAMKASPFHVELDFETQFTIPADLSTRFDSVILLDGTWRNTRELLHHNSWLQALPTLALKNVEASNYRIRKAAQANALATIEAVSELLSVLECQFDKAAFLLPFRKMIDAQIDKMGADVYARNYHS